MNFYKKDTLNDKFEEFEKRFQLKLDEQNITHNQQIQKLNDKIARLETENSRTYELIDKLYEYRFKEISCQITHEVSECNNKIDNTFKPLHEELQNITNQINILNNNQKEISIETQNINKFYKQIDTLSKQQQFTNEKVIALNHEVSKINDDVSSIENSVSAITENITALEDRQCLVDMYDLKIMVERIVKLEDKQLFDCNDLKKITKQINILTTKQSLTDDILLNIKNDIILINTDSRIGNTSQHNVINELSEKIKILADNVSNIQNINNKFDKDIHKLTTQQELTNNNLNVLEHSSALFCKDALQKIKILTDNVSNIQNINNKFDREIHTLTTQQQVTTEKLDALQKDTNTWSCIDTTIITDKLEICMNAIKLINVFEEPMFGRQMTRRNTEIYNATNRYLGTSIISLDTEPHEFSYINQFYNLQVLVINNWNLFNYGVFCPNNRSSKADNFKMMCDRYGEMNNKTLETFIIHCAYDFNTWCSPGAPTHRREPLLLEYLCMQLKNFPSLKIVKLYYLDLPLNIGDIIINNLENMRHTIKELHIISNTIQQASRLKMYCNKKKIILKEVILLKDKSVEAFQRDVITPLNQKQILEDGGYMRRNKIIDRT